MERFTHRYFIPLDDGGIPKHLPNKDGQGRKAVHQQSIVVKDKIRGKFLVVDTVDEREHLTEATGVLFMPIDRSVEGMIDPETTVPKDPEDALVARGGK